MSTWTHVTGAIRIDSISSVIAMMNPIWAMQQPSTEESIQAALEQDLPHGSEGPIEFLIHEYPDPFEGMNMGMCVGKVMWGGVTIWGDLRDYEDVGAIEDWFHGVLDRLVADKQMIRDAVLAIDLPGRQQKIVRPLPREDEPSATLCEEEVKLPQL